MVVKKASKESYPIMLLKRENCAELSPMQEQAMKYLASCADSLVTCGSFSVAMARMHANSETQVREVFDSLEKDNLLKYWVSGGTKTVDLTDRGVLVARAIIARDLAAASSEIKKLIESENFERTSLNSLIELTKTFKSVARDCDGEIKALKGMPLLPRKEINGGAP